jgi:hypothetical protein
MHLMRSTRDQDRPSKVEEPWNFQLSNARLHADIGLHVKCLRLDKMKLTLRIFHKSQQSIQTDVEWADCQGADGV